MGEEDRRRLLEDVPCVDLLRQLGVVLEGQRGTAPQRLVMLERRGACAT
jgi:hypothetical protein